MIGHQEAGWCVVIAKPQHVALAEANIRALGYEVDFLWHRRLLKDKRILVNGRRVRDPKAEVLRPTFTPYGFVLIDYGRDACDIDNAMGVQKLIRHAPLEGDRVGRPKRVRATIVDALRQKSRDGEFDDPELRPQQKATFPAGAKVRFRDRIDSMVFEVQELDDEGRVHYFLEMLGGTDGWFSREQSLDLELVGA